MVLMDLGAKYGSACAGDCAKLRETLFFIDRRMVHEGNWREILRLSVGNV